MSGTEVRLYGMDAQWFRAVHAESLAHEIELHFERILARPGLTVTVRECVLQPHDVYSVPCRKPQHHPPHRQQCLDDVQWEKAVTCRPFDYSSVEGSYFRRMFDVRQADGRYQLS